MQRWEYTTLSFWLDKDDWVFEYDGKRYPVSERISIMSKMGHDGWELVSALPFENFKMWGQSLPTTYTDSYMLFFKRSLEAV
jgi:hypothetical protein